MKFALLFAISWPLLAQTTIYLRDSAPAAIWPTAVTGNGVAVVITFAGQSTAGIVANDHIACHNFYGNSAPNGTYKVKAVTATTLALKNEDNTDLLGNGTWSRGDEATISQGGAAQWCGLVHAYSLVSGPRGWLDGTNGTFSRQLALGANNGLVAFTVSSHVASATLPNGFVFAAGADKISVTGSGNATLDTNNGVGAFAPYTFITDDSTHIHFTVPNSVPDGDYTNGVTTCGAGANQPCMRLSMLGWKGNPAWDRVVAETAAEAVTLSTCRQDVPGSGYGCSLSRRVDDSMYQVGLHLVSWGYNWWVDQQNSTALNAMLYWFDHPERVGSVTFPADEGNYASGFNLDLNYEDGAYFTSGLGFTASLVKDRRSGAQQTVFLNKILNNITDPGGCTKNLPIVGSGTLAIGALTTYVGTLTCVGCQFLTNADTSQRIAAGDSIDLAVSPSLGAGESQYYVNSVTNDTTATVTVLSSRTTSDDAGAKSGITNWSIFHQWQTGNCGWLWSKLHYEAEIISHPLLYPTRAGGTQSSSTTTQPLAGSNNAARTAQQMSGYCALADMDARALYLCSAYQSYDHDFILPGALSVWTGLNHINASLYGWGNGIKIFETQLFNVRNSFVNFPTYGDTTLKRIELTKIYQLLPWIYAGDQWLRMYSGNNGANISFNYGGIPFQSMLYDLTSLYAPTSDEAQYYRHWLVNNPLADYTVSGYIPLFDAGRYLARNPFVSATNKPYTSLPKQILFQENEYALCATFIGASCPLDVREDAVISKTDWTTHATDMFFGSRGGIYSDYDTIDSPSLRFGADGLIVSRDDVAESMTPNATDLTVLGDVLQVGGPGSTNFFSGNNDASVAPQYGTSPITRSNFGSQLHGAAPTRPAGNDSFVYAMSDASGLFKAAANVSRYHDHVMHFKKSGSPEHIVERVDVALSSPATISKRIHFAQNGEAAPPTTTYEPAEGTTTCLGGGGCPSLNTNRQMLSQQNGTPPYTNGTVASIFGDGTIEVSSLGSAYGGGNGHTFAINVCATACGNTASTFGEVIDYKVTHLIADNTSDAVALNPDSNWTGTRGTGFAALFSKGGTLRSTVPAFTLPAGTNQVGIAGLTAGSWTATIAGVSAPGSPYTVTNGDNSLYLEPGGLSGSLVLTLGGGGSCTITTASLPDGQVGVPYSQTISTNGGCAAPLSWDLSAGSLPTGLPPIGASTGTIAGTPAIAGDYSFTVRVTDTNAVVATQALAIHVIAAPTTGNTGRAGGGRMTSGSTAVR